MVAKKGSRKAVKLVKKGSRKKKAAEPKDVLVLDAREHEIVPKHEKMSDKDAKALMAQYHATLKELPKIHVDDPAIRALGLKQGDIVKITRKSHTAGKTVFYRGVVNE